MLPEFLAIKKKIKIKEYEWSYALCGGNFFQVIKENIEMKQNIFLLL